MASVQRSTGWVWSGRAVGALGLAGLVVYLAWVGLDKADKTASAIGAVVAVAALIAPYLLPAPSAGGAATLEADEVENTAKATATGRGQANTGVQSTDATRSAHVKDSGQATAHGPGSIANTGIQRGPRP
jgi:hypothetical protein